MTFYFINSVVPGSPRKPPQLVQLLVHKFITILIRVYSPSFQFFEFLNRMNWANASSGVTGGNCACERIAFFDCSQWYTLGTIFHCSSVIQSGFSCGSINFVYYKCSCFFFISQLIFSCVFNMKFRIFSQHFWKSCSWGRVSACNNVKQLYNRVPGPRMRFSFCYGAVISPKTSAADAAWPQGHEVTKSLVHRLRRLHRLNTLFLIFDFHRGESAFACGKSWFRGCMVSNS